MKFCRWPWRHFRPGFALIHDMRTGRQHRHRGTGSRVKTRGRGETSSTCTLADTRETTGAKRQEKRDKSRRDVGPDGQAWRRRSGPFGEDGQGPELESGWD